MTEYRNREDLKIRTIAKFKAMRDSDLHLYDDLDSGKIDLAHVKGLAFEDSEFEEEERILNHMRNVKKQKDEDTSSDGRRSSNSELRVSVRSSYNYFMKLEENKGERTFTKQYQDKRQKQRKHEEEDKQRQRDNFELSYQIAELQAKVRAMEQEVKVQKMQT
jgi:hypothetical protein